MKLLAIDLDPRTKLGPSIAHDLELQANRRQLRWRRVTYFYFKLFHISFIVIGGPSPSCTIAGRGLKPAECI